MYLQGIIQIAEEMAIAMETAVFATHLQITSAAVLFLGAANSDQSRSQN